jgi:hypothetical protein
VEEWGWGWRGGCGCAVGGSRLGRRQGFEAPMYVAFRGLVSSIQHTSKVARIPPGHGFEAGAFSSVMLHFAFSFSLFS